MYKLLAIDIDGTLIKSDQTISNEVKDAIFKAKEKGVYITLISGRNYFSMKHYLDELKIDDYALTINGGIVIELNNKEILLKHYMDEDILSSIIDILEINPVPYAIFADYNVFVENRFKDHETVGMLDSIEGNVIYFDNLKELTKKQPINKFMFMPSEQNLQSISETISGKFANRLNIEYGYSEHVEIYPSIMNKGIALLELAKKLGIKGEEIMAIGDAENDIPMLEVAGLGVAMGNAIMDVKNYADYITNTNENDGVAIAIDKFILSGN